MFSALNFLFDILIDFPIFLTCESQVFCCNSWSQISSAVLCKFDGISAADSECNEVFLLMPCGPRPRRKAGFYFVEIYKRDLIWY